MAKCMKNSQGGVIRVSDELAAIYNKQYNYQYCPKQAWKSQKAAELKAEEATRNV